MDMEFVAFVGAILHDPFFDRPNVRDDRRRHARLERVVRLPIHRHKEGVLALREKNRAPGGHRCCREPGKTPAAAPDQLRFAIGRRRGRGG